jgi:hypothetical protein
VDESVGWGGKLLLVVICLAVAGGIGYAALDDNVGEPEPAEWRLATPTADLDPSTRQLPIVVHELACSSGRTAEGRIVAAVQYTADQVAVEIGVRPRQGDVDCQGNPATPFVVELDEPLGERSIIGEMWTRDLAP